MNREYLIDIFNELFEIKYGEYSIDEHGGYVWNRRGSIVWKNNGGVGSSKHVAGEDIGWTCKNGYRNVKITILGRKTTLKVHRISYSLYNNILAQDDLVCDYIDGDKQNNDPRNLRLVPHIENLYNRKKSRVDSTYGLLGVNRYGKGKWRTRLSNVNRHLGVYECPVEAVLAYWDAKFNMYPEMTNQWLSIRDEQLLLANNIKKEINNDR